MSQAAALDALALAQSRRGLGAAQLGRDLVVALLVLVIADARGLVPEVAGSLDALARARGPRWPELVEIFARVARARGRALVEVEALSEARARLDEDALAELLDALLDCRGAGPALLGVVYEAGRSGVERRRDSTHYTPTAMARELLVRALEPVEAVVEGGSGELRVCDPAMGTGVFVVEAARALGARLGGDPLARLRAAAACVYGVDEDPGAVALARLSLWLECGDADLPWTCFDHNLRCADALVGLEPAQLARVHWDVERGSLLAWVTQMIDEARAAGAALGEVLRAPIDGVEALIRRAEAARAHRARTAALRELGDELLAAFFSATKVRSREVARAQVARREASATSSGLRPLHWWLALPELDGRGFDLVVGNPPFLGKNSLLAKRGRAYLDWLKRLHPGSHGNADYAAHFFRRAAHLVADSGTIGLVATNTIAQGDTRATGLAALVADGWRIYAAARNLEWPGAAHVTVSIVHLARGAAAERGPAPLLDGRAVEAIDSRLRAGPERPEPARLAENRGRAFIGTYLLGQGFVLDADEREALVAARAQNAGRIRPYIGGGQLNRSPDQASARYVIDFGSRSLAEAEAWPELLARVRERVKPQRDRLADNPDGRRRKRCWWQHGRVTPSLEAALAPLDRCIVTSLVNKHLCFAFQPADRLFSHKLCVFPLDSAAALAVLQSRVHLSWAWLLSSTMRNAGINYSPSDCFETFALPPFGPALERAGAALDRTRASFMRTSGRGLTQTYNALADPARDDPAIVALREVHEAVDRAVLDAYGWADVEVPAYLGQSGLEEFERVVLDRLFALNAARRAAQPA